MKKHITILSLAAGIALAGCAKVIPQEAGGISPAPFLTIEAECPKEFFVAEDGHLAEAAPTKSSARASNSTAIDDVNIWVYRHDGGALVSSLHKTSSELSSLSGADLFTDGGEGLYDIFLLANVGARTAPESSASAKSAAYDVSGLKAMSAFPLAGCYEGIGASSMTLRVKRLVSQYNFTFTQGSVNDNTYTIRSMQVRNMNANVRPFGAGYAATSVTSVGGDALSSADLAKATAQSGVVTVYAFENCQGTVPGISDPEDKTLQSLRDKGKDYSKLTYFEIKADVYVKSEAKLYKDVYYRYYFGSGENYATTDFNINRNTVYNFTINFDNIRIASDGWRVAADSPYSLVINPSSISVKKGSTGFLSGSVYQGSTLVSGNVGCSWSVVSGSSFASVSSSGTVTGKAAGTATVQGSYVYEGATLISTAGVTVTDEPAVAKNFTITQSACGNAGCTPSLKVECGSDVSWSISVTGGYGNTYKASLSQTSGTGPATISATIPAITSEVGLDEIDYYFKITWGDDSTTKTLDLEQHISYKVKKLRFDVSKTGGNPSYFIVTAVDGMSPVKLTITVPYYQSHYSGTAYINANTYQQQTYDNYPTLSINASGITISPDIYRCYDSTLGLVEYQFVPNN